MSIDRTLERLRRLEQQIRAFKELHQNELQIILDELADLTAELSTANDTANDLVTEKSPTDDPAANSPKRAKWLAEQERKRRPLSRRELLRGRDQDPS